MEPTGKSLSFLSGVCFDIYLVELVEILTEVVLHVAGVVITSILVLVCVCGLLNTSYNI